MNTTEPLERLNAIRDANYHHGGVCCLRLLQLDAPFFASLQAETTHLCDHQQPSQVTLPGHVTHWTRPSGQVVQYSLLNATGQYDDFTTDHNLSIFGKRFHGAGQYSALAQLIDAFPHAVNFRVNLLGPGAKLSPHEEHSVVRTQAGSVSLRLRLHLPVITNPGAELMLEGNIYHLEPGFVYFVNHGCFHSAQNTGSQARVHLVWDVLLTRETDALLFGADPDLPIPARRLPPHGQALAPLRAERLGPVRRLPAPVDENEARELAFFEPQ